uniref:Uncharacterized protein n=1 Tax=Helianthus annuus TaxID=4232 RepID=A0A251SBW2_HELAN
MLSGNTVEASGSHAGADTRLKENFKLLGIASTWMMIKSMLLNRTHSRSSPATFVIISY